MNYYNPSLREYPVTQEELVKEYPDVFNGSFSEELAIELGYFPVIETQKPEGRCYETWPSSMGGFWYQTWNLYVRYELFPVSDGKWGFLIYDYLGNSISSVATNPDNGSLMSQEECVFVAEDHFEVFVEDEKKKFLPVKTVSVVEEVTETKIGKVEFLGRLSFEEQKAYLRLSAQIKYAYATGIASGEMDGEIEDANTFLTMFDLAQYVNLKYPDTISGITMIGKKLGFSDERITEILKV